MAIDEESQMTPTLSEPERDPAITPAIPTEGADSVRARRAPLSRLVSSGRRGRILAAGAGIVVVALVAGGIALVSGLSSAEADASSVGSETAAGSASEAKSGGTTTPRGLETASPTEKPVAVTPKPASDDPDAAPAFEVGPKPEALVPIGCEGLVSEDLRMRVMGDGGTLYEDIGRPARDDGVAAEWQAGVRHCVWFSAGETASLELHLLPDAVDDFRAFSTLFGTYGSDALGPDSRLDCTPRTPTSVWSCRGGFTAAGHWVEFNFGGANANGDEAPYGLAAELGASIEAALDAAGPARTREDLGSAPSCDRFDSAGLRGAVASPNLGAPVADVFGLTLTEAAFRRAGFGICSWSGSSAGNSLPGVSIGILPGGGWAVPEPATFAAKYPTGDAELVAITGAEAAVRTCFHAYGHCSIQASVRGTLVTVSTVTPTNSGRDAEADVLAAARFLIANLPR
ncbi:hypothetical protein [Agromyces mariniharenae]|uniref:hypothetical protein n=1 Tax=Agromyces mariniharenae TaxID=2604423 RepID=UPI0016532683|nr:hypothetical protein [Agromyces mariniharenae]